MSNSNRSDRVYQDLKIFVEDHNGNKHPLNIGYAYEDGGKMRFRITAFPPPGARTDWSGLIESREDRGERGQSNNGGSREQAPARGGADRPAFGGGQRGFGGRDSGGYRSDIE